MSIPKDADEDYLREASTDVQFRKFLVSSSLRDEGMDTI